MRVNDQIKEELRVFSSSFGPKTIEPAKVISVNDNDTVEVVFSNGVTIYDVRLKSIVKDGDKVLLIPKVNSIVQVARIANSNELVVLAVHEVSEIKWQVGDLHMSYTSEGLQLYRDAPTASLKQLLTQLVEAVEQIVVLQGNNPDYPKLLNVKSLINNLLK